MRTIHPTFLALLLLLVPLTAPAENSTHANGYTVHHNAIKCDFLTPEVAQAYGVQRSKYRGLVNISVIQEEAGTTGHSVPARIVLTAANLNGVPKPIELREIREGDAIYYIDDFPVTDGEIVVFTLEVTPDGEQQPIHARFSQQFFID